MNIAFGDNHLALSLHQKIEGIAMAICTLCLKSAQKKFNRPHSQHRTITRVKPNLQRASGMMLCSSCRRTVSRLQLAELSAHPTVA